MSQITYRSNTAVRMTTTKKYDHLNRLLDISSVPSAASAVRFSYSYNDLNQRTRRTDADESYWSYEYDSLGQVTSGKHYWPDATPVAGQQFEYAYDDIGNRRRTREGGDAAGSGLRTAHYTVNNLNQYTQRDVPGAADIIGIGYPFAPVTVNDQSTYRRGEYYHKELAIDNSSAPVWQSVTNQATYTPSATNTSIGNLLLPKTPQMFWCDSDGNTLSDFVWTNRWDGENRLTLTENIGSVPSAGRVKETWIPDAEGRWAQRIIYSWNGSTYVPESTNRLLWSGPLLTAMLDQNNSVAVSFMRGLDHGLSLDSAGGTGGMLTVNIVTNGSHFPVYDGNGNVVGLAKATDGILSAAYEYAPFGRSLRITGPVAYANPVRFGTQIANDRTANTKYLFRDYTPGSGQWLQRDLLQEYGGLNLNAYCANDPINRSDSFGLIDDDPNLIGPDNIIALDKTFPKTHTTTYAYATPYNVVCYWKTKGKLKIPAGSYSSEVKVYPTGASSGRKDSSVIAVFSGGGESEKKVTVLRPKTLTRSAFRGPTFANVLGYVNFSAIFQLRVDDQFGEPLKGVFVDEKLTWVTWNVAGGPPTTGGGVTNEKGEVSDIYWLNFLPDFQPGFASVDQKVLVGNWEAHLYTYISATEFWNGTMKTTFE